MGEIFDWKEELFGAVNFASKEYQAHYSLYLKLELIQIGNLTVNLNNTKQGY